MPEGISGAILDGINPPPNHPDPPEYLKESLEKKNLHRKIHIGIAERICERSPAEISRDSSDGISRCNPTRNCKEMSAGTAFLRNLWRNN